MKKSVFIVASFLSLFSCTKYLSEKEENYMPYQTGDQLVFMNPKTNDKDSVSITRVRKFVPDGEKLVFNELMIAYETYGKNDTPFILLESGNKPKLQLRRFHSEKYLSDISKESKLEVITPLAKYNDVVVFDGKHFLRDETKTFKIYWSISTGIIEYRDSNNNTWQLIDFNRKGID